jgi:hypothetical protein
MVVTAPSGYHTDPSTVSSLGGVLWDESVQADRDAVALLTLEISGPKSQIQM